MPGLGTVINLCTVLVGGVAGVYAGHRLPDRTRATVMQGLGLATIAVAVVGFAPLLDEDTGLQRAVVMVVALAVAAVVGETLRLEERLERAGEALKRRMGASDDAQLDVAARSPFVEGFVVASTVFCAGPLTVLGSVEDGLGAGIRLLAIKSTLDGIAATGFASVYGWGVLGSLITIAVVQGGITAIATLVEPVLTAEVLAELEIVGSALVLGIGFRLLEMKPIRVVNLAPAILIGPAIAGVVEAIG